MKSIPAAEAVCHSLQWCAMAGAYLVVGVLACLGVNHFGSTHLQQPAPAETPQWSSVACRQDRAQGGDWRLFYTTRTLVVTTSPVTPQCSKMLL
jgi:hypothetical protein